MSLMAAVVLTAACDKAEQAVRSASDGVACSLVSAVDSAIPSAGSLDEQSVARLGRLVAPLDTALAKLPTDALPAGVGDQISKVADDLSASAKDFATNPAAARRAAESATSTLRTALGKVKTALHCS